MKKRIKINESTLRRIVTESVKRVLKEGMTTDNPYYDRWNEAKDFLGAEQMLECIWNYLDASQLEQIIDWLNQDYELWDDEEEEDEEEEIEDDGMTDMGQY